VMSPRVSNLARSWRHTTREPDVADLAPDTGLDEERAITGLDWYWRRSARAFGFLVITRRPSHQ
jgi:hypothetical protein